MRSQRRFDLRRSERVDVGGDVTLRVYLTRTDDVREVEAKLVNAGVGGLYVRAEDCDLPLGALTDLEIRLDGTLLAATLGLVRWVDPDGHGAGLEFFYSTDEERDALRLYLLEWQRAACQQRQAMTTESRSTATESATVIVDTPLSHH